MGYTRIVQYADINLVYTYSKSLNPNRKKHVQKRKRDNSGKIRLRRNIQRARDSFYRLCHHNVASADTVTLATLTLPVDVSYSVFSRYVSDFFARLKKYVSSFQNQEISYIGVPELTKKGRYHMHLLIFNLPPSKVTTERDTRNFQRLYGRGYSDFRLAHNRSPRLASYLAKYMAKTLGDSRHTARRAYNCSRNIKKITSYGSNTLDTYVDDIIDGSLIKTYNYETKYFGACKLSVYKK